MNIVARVLALSLAAPVQGPAAPPVLDILPSRAHKLQRPVWMRAGSRSKKPHQMRLA